MLEGRCREASKTRSSFSPVNFSFFQALEKETIHTIFNASNEKIMSSNRAGNNNSNAYHIPDQVEINDEPDAVIGSFTGSANSSLGHSQVVDKNIPTSAASARSNPMTIPSTVVVNNTSHTHSEPNQQNSSTSISHVNKSSSSSDTSTSPLEDQSWINWFCTLPV